MINLLPLTEFKPVFNPRLYPFEGYYTFKGLPPMNREGKRKVQKETNRIIIELLTIENYFINFLFGEEYANDNTTYIEAYRYHKELYENMCDWLNNNFKPKFVTIDREYFEKEYKPEI